MEVPAPRPGPRRLLLDVVSDDIRDLEQYFLDSGLRTPIHLEFHDSGILPDEGNDLDSYAGRMYQLFVETVAWEPIGDETSWRLTYRKEKRLGIMAPMGGMDGPTFDYSEDIEHCPLVDAPASDRIRAHRALPDLLQEAGTLARARSA
jgi:hypothetical protein